MGINLCLSCENLKQFTNDTKTYCSQGLGYNGNKGSMLSPVAFTCQSYKSKNWKNNNVITLPAVTAPRVIEGRVMSSENPEKVLRYWKLP